MHRREYKVQTMCLPEKSDWTDKLTGFLGRILISNYGQKAEGLTRGFFQRRDKDLRTNLNLKEANDS